MLNRIKDLRLSRGLSMKSAAAELDMPYTTYVNYEKGFREPNSEMLIKIADFFCVSVDYLLGRSDDPIDYDNDGDALADIPLGYVEAAKGDMKKAREIMLAADEDARREVIHSYAPGNIIPMPKMRRVPLLGTIACGTPITAEQNYDGDVDIPSNIHADFALRCKGNSMINARIFDGDICYIRQQPTVENGQIAAVMVDGEATLKRVRLFDDHIILEPQNPRCMPMIYWGEEMSAVTILGLAVAFTSSIF